MTDDGLPRAPHSIADFVHAYENDGRLRGFRCPNCGLVTATWGMACSRCGRVGLEEFGLAPTGRVVAFTVVAVPGDELLNEAPYAYAVVELDGGGRLTGWIAGVRAESDLPLGTRVRWNPSYKPGVQFVREPSTGGGALGDR